MKKNIQLFLFIICLVEVKAQESLKPIKPPLSHTDSLQYAKIKNINLKLKKSKGAYAVAGIGIIGGAVMSYSKAKLKTPMPGDYKTQHDYEAAVNVYEGKNKGLGLYSSALFGIAGCSLLFLAINF